MNDFPSASYDAWKTRSDMDEYPMNETKCEECGAPVEDDYILCYVCAQRNNQIEAEVDEIRSASRTEDDPGV